MKISEMKESKYLKKEDCGEGGIIVTIASVSQENVGTDLDPEDKYVLHFKEDLKPMVLNWTNIQLISQVTGQEDTDNWTGKQVVLYNDPTVSFGDKLVGGIRVKSAKQTRPQAAPQRQESENPAPAEFNDDLPPGF